MNLEEYTMLLTKSTMYNSYKRETEIYHGAHRCETLYCKLSKTAHNIEYTCPITYDIYGDNETNLCVY